MNREGPPQPHLIKFDSKSSIKIGKDGLEAENATSAFDHVKADVKVRAGKWYYEVRILSSGVMRFGWCSDKCHLGSDALGSTTDSWALDTYYRVSYNGTHTERFGDYWSSGDVLGCVLDLEAKTIAYYRNGTEIGVAFSGVTATEPLCPAASLQKKQKCLFNFGKEPFSFPVTEVFPDIRALHINITKEQQVSLDKLFDKYRDIGHKETGERDDVIRGNGSLTYSSELGISDDKDPGLLVVAWKLNATTKVWEFTRGEFVGGWSVLGCWNLDTMKRKLREWKDELKNPAKFKPFYNFCFDYLKEEKKILSTEEAVTVWEMLGLHSSWSMMAKFVEFLTATNKKAVSRDTWRLFLNFVEQYPKSFAQYDADGCWPSLLDEFVEWTAAGAASS
eukprot:TRINITY_DN10640_c0_g1_i1.p1 TRINITY_DN10640_c0_g1~~TRINITY_DN10640_c0_g1_i1.p1  ORF type:complete len:391 (-),score=133.22 TRINITY_DN10640_c0_g1_i1:147-1319(-)